MWLQMFTISNTCQLGHPTRPASYTVEDSASESDTFMEAGTVLLICMFQC